eukprot:11478192-Alexandrium_andersonii.AAC.1
MLTTVGARQAAPPPGRRLESLCPRCLTSDTPVPASPQHDCLTSTRVSHGMRTRQLGAHVQMLSAAGLG